MMPQFTVQCPQMKEILVHGNPSGPSSYLWTAKGRPPGVESWLGTGAKDIKYFLSAEITTDANGASEIYCNYMSDIITNNNKNTGQKVGYIKSQKPLSTSVSCSFQAGGQTCKENDPSKCMIQCNPTTYTTSCPSASYLIKFCNAPGQWQWTGGCPGANLHLGDFGYYGEIRDQNNLICYYSYEMGSYQTWMILNDIWACNFNKTSGNEQFCHSEQDCKFFCSMNPNNRSRKAKKETKR